MDELKELLRAELQEVRSLHTEQAAHAKQGIVAIAFQIVNTLGLVLVIMSIFYFGLWKGAVDQNIQTFQDFISDGDRYTEARGAAAETRLEKLERSHDADIVQLRRERSDDRKEILLELREIRSIIQKDGRK